MTSPKTIMIDEVKYVRADSIKAAQAPSANGLTHCIIRSYAAGVFAGYLKTKTAEPNGVNATLINSRRIWSWRGACSISQLATEGSKLIEECKIAVVVPTMTVFNVVEIIPTSKQAHDMIEGAKEWKL